MASVKSMGVLTVGIEFGFEIQKIQSSIQNPNRFFVSSIFRIKRTKFNSMVFNKLFLEKHTKNNCLKKTKFFLITGRPRF